MSDTESLPTVACRNATAHEGHRHVNEGRDGGCGLPEWCPGVTQLPDLRVRAVDAYAALRVIGDAAKTAADVLLEERVIPAAEAVGATTFTTPFGKVYASKTEGRVEILTSADLRAWVMENLPWQEERGDPIIPEHYEDTFDERQLRRAAHVLSKHVGVERHREVAVTVLRAAFPPRLVPERIAEWVIPYLAQRAVMGVETTAGDLRFFVYDGETGEEWPWATAVPEHVGWSARLSKDAKAETAGLILDRVSDFAVLVGVKEIGQ